MSVPRSRTLDPALTLLCSGTLVIKGFGFSTLNTTLLQIPYGTFIALMIFAAIYINHKTHARNIRVSRL